MRLNVYKGEIIKKVELAEYDGDPASGVRVHLTRSFDASVDHLDHERVITFWSPQDLRTALNKILAELNSLEGINEHDTTQT